MNCGNSHRYRCDSGFALPMAMVLTLILLVMGIAFLELSRIDATRSVREMQDIQASAAAEFGMARAKAMALSQKAPWYVMDYNGGSLSFGSSQNPLYGGQICTLFNSVSVGNDVPATYSVVIEDTSGWLPTSGSYRIHAFGMCGPFMRHIYTDSRALTYASFGWLTNDEDGIYFTDGDVVDGMVHTNGRINIWGDPTFKGKVFSASDSVRYAHGGPPSDDPDFQQGLTLNAPYLDIGSLLTSGHITAIRNKALEANGIWLGANGGRPYSVEFNSNGTVTIQKRRANGKWQSVLKNQSLATLNGAIYIEEEVWVEGELDGQVTIATPKDKDIVIVDNILYAYPPNGQSMWADNFDPNNPLFNDKLALVSGGDVVVGKEWDNSWSDMYVAASIAAVDGKFYNENYTRSPDKTLHIYGGITQDTRGPVGQVGGRGFVKDYKYDTRFLDSPPPHLPAIGYEFSNWSLDL